MIGDCLRKEELEGEVVEHGVNVALALCNHIVGYQGLMAHNEKWVYYYARRCVPQIQTPSSRSLPITPCSNAEVCTGSSMLFVIQIRARYPVPLLRAYHSTLS